MLNWRDFGGIREKVALVLIAVFAAGGGTGYFAGRWHARKDKNVKFSTKETKFRAHHPDRRMQRHFIRRLERDLNLQTDQMQKIQAALQQQHNKMMQLRIEMHPQVERILHDARNEIRTLLHSDQQLEFAQLIREFEEQKQRMYRRIFRRR
jgi:sugar-specific transcriptional regulator TrmB